MGIFSNKKSIKKVVKSIPYEIESDVFFADISHHEEDFNGKTYNAKILINKCSDGTSFVDKTHAPRKKECGENGIKYVGYHFYQCYKDPIKQAEHYVKTHGAFELNPIIDYEKDRDQDETDLIKEVDNLYKCLIEVKRLTGKTPILYSYLGLFDQLQLDDRFKEFYLWLARYNSKMERIPSPFSPEKLIAYQYSDGGETYRHKIYPNSFTGIGECDSNIYNCKLDLFGICKGESNV